MSDIFKVNKFAKNKNHNELPCSNALDCILQTCKVQNMMNEGDNLIKLSEDKVLNDMKLNNSLLHNDKQDYDTKNSKTYNGEIALNLKTLNPLMINHDNSRYTWGNQLEFVLSLIGYAVSLGNVWRFPYLCYRNGGGAFLIPYWLMLFLCGIPLFFLEVVLGQFTGRGAIDVWDICPLFKGVGIGTVLLTAIGSTSYNLLVALILFYLFASFRSDLPWGHCDQTWNTPACVVLRVLNDTNENNGTTNDLIIYSQYNYNITTSLTDIQTSAFEFWSHRVLQISDGLHNMGDINVKLMGCFFLAWILTFLCLVKGIKTTGKIVYFTATFPYLILTVLLIRSMFLPGALKGVLFFLKPDWSKLKNVKIWNEAATQIFYSLGPGWSGLITMASYNKFRNNCLRDSIIVSVVNCGTSVFAGLVVFSVIGFMSHILSVPIEKVATHGVGLAFIVYPEALLHLPFSNVWSVLFFAMLLTIGIDTIFVQLEVVYSAIYDMLPIRYRNRRASFTLIASIIMMVLGLPFLLKGGIFLFQLVDWYLAILSVIIFCLFETITVTWIYGADRFVGDIEFMLNKKIWAPKLWIFLWKYLIPLLLSKLTYSLQPSLRWGPPLEPFRSQYLDKLEI
ncbi:sodium- and chloride-dependent glycine transporter 1-like isoform X2 [Gordionus sp. m RMFG-2023]|uniref:sodium- and chloride-dependent glycine transporter 1-like isoform X2 n=1 Tax=Gordionus sp. m RMFG-2023 TaxID=3053472 RepID=UPI0031FBD439